MGIEGDSQPGKRYAIIAVTLSLGALAVVGFYPDSRASEASLDVVFDQPSDAVPGPDNTATTGHGAKMREPGVDIVVEQDTTSTHKPHIVLFTVDDMGWNDIGYISTDLPEATSYASSLADKGVKLTHYYTQPSCTPSRVTLMTGKFVYRNGFQNYELQHSDAIGLPLSNVLMPEHMKTLGYETHGMGKWNIGHCSSKYLPHERGFDHYLGYLCPGHGYTDYECGMGAGVHDMIEGWASTKDDTTTYTWETGDQYKGTYDTLLYKEKSVAAIKHHANTYPDDENDKPFFLWAAMHGIHSELDANPIPPDEMLTVKNHAYLKGLEKSWVSDEAEQQKFFKKRLITASVLMSVDNCLKGIVEALEETKMLSNTILFFNSDNGGDTVYTKGHPGNNFPLRSEKFGYFEGGVRVPAFVFAPGRIPLSRVGSSYHGLMHHVDLVTTFYGLGGGDVDALKTTYDDLDGFDHWSAIKGESTGPRSELVLNLPRSPTWKLGEDKTSEGVAIRVGNFKLLLNHEIDYWFAPDPGPDHHDASEMMASMCQYDFYSLDDNDQCERTNFLFDISTDPYEKTNLWDNDDYKVVKAAILTRVAEIIADQKMVGDTGKTYGEIIPASYEKPPMDYAAAFEAHGDYVVPWNCDIVT